MAIITYDNDGTPHGQGSGFISTISGEVITNLHVIEGASRAEIKTPDGKVYPVTHIVAEDTEGDLVRISAEIPAGKLKPLKLTSVIPQVGEQIVIVGNPLGLEGTASTGIVSAVRDIPTFGKIIQLSAP